MLALHREAGFRVFGSKNLLWLQLEAHLHRNTGDTADAAVGPDAKVFCPAPRSEVPPKVCCGCTEKRVLSKKNRARGQKNLAGSLLVKSTLWLQREAGFHVFCSKSMLWLHRGLKKPKGPETPADGRAPLWTTRSTLLTTTRTLQLTAVRE